MTSMKIAITTINMFDFIAFDADDTLWHNEGLYSATQDRFAQLLVAYQDNDQVQQQLYQTELRNLGLFGYGIKGFTLSMIETAIELTEGQICGRDIQAIIDLAKEMLQAPVRLIDGVRPVLAELAPGYRLMLITKGDLFDQETKIARSGLADYFAAIEIVSEKTPAIYAALLAKHDLRPDRFLMVGNSLRSDVLPVLEAGGRAVHIPYHLTWAHEQIEPPAEEQSAYFVLDRIEQLPGLLEQLGR